MGGMVNAGSGYAEYEASPIHSPNSLTPNKYAIPVSLFSEITASKVDYSTSLNFSPNGLDTFRVEADGRLFWKGREVESDDELRSAMLEIKRYLTAGVA